MFKKRSKGFGGIRKRTKLNDGSSSEDDTKVVRSQKKPNLSHPLIQQSNHRSNRKNITEDSSSSDSNDEIGASYKSSRAKDREGPVDMGATAHLEIDTEKEKDAQSIFERAQEVNKETKGQPDDKIYRGINNYSQFYEKRDTAQGNASSGGVRKGPIRAPDHIRASVRWDYQPDLCKDFKETGFCGFGDSCKFLHDRTDYKQGWQLEIENNKTSRNFQEDSDENYEIPSDEEYLPFKCFICRNSFTDPIITKCKHYFCEKCALDQFKKTKRCYSCGENTRGMFQPARNLINRLEKANDSDCDD